MPDVDESTSRSKPRTEPALFDPPERPKKKLSPFKLGLLSLIGGVVGGAASFYILSTYWTPSITTEERQQLVLQESEIIAEIAAEVEPSVVSVLTETTVRGFFSRGISEGAGSGIILTEDGLIVTNSHVIPENYEGITIIDSEGEEYSSVELIDRDPFNDIAYLQIEGVNDLRPAELGNSSDMRVGEKVVAIGNALGRFDNTVTSGIISGLGRPIVAGGAGDSAESLTNLFQTDAAINPGNSGGPLLNMNGQVIGINTAVAEGENIGFAIPIDDVTPGIESVKANDRLVKPYLGVRYITLTPAIAEEFELSADYGAYIISNAGEVIIAGSPAADAGLQEEDIITAIDGVKLDDSHTLSSLIGRRQVGDEVRLTVVRSDETLELTTMLKEVPSSLE